MDFAILKLSETIAVREHALCTAVAPVAILRIHAGAIGTTRIDALIGEFRRLRVFLR